MSNLPKSVKPSQPVRTSVAVVKPEGSSHVRSVRQGLSPFVFDMKDQSVSVVAIEPTAHVRLTCTWKVAANITPSSFQSAHIAKVGFCRKPAFYLPVAGSRPPEMAL